MTVKEKVVTFLLQPDVSKALDNEDLDTVYRKYYYTIDCPVARLTEFLVNEVYGDLSSVVNNISCLYKNMFADITLPTATLKLPDNIKDICDLAFAYSKFTSIELPTGLTKIGMYAFSNTPLKEIYISKTVEEVGGQLFSGCNLLERIFCGPKGRPGGWNYFWAEGHEDKVLWGATPENIKLYKNLLS